MDRYHFVTIAFALVVTHKVARASVESAQIGPDRPTFGCKKTPHLPAQTLQNSCRCGVLCIGLCGVEFSLRSPIGAEHRTASAGWVEGRCGRRVGSPSHRGPPGRTPKPNPIRRGPDEGPSRRHAQWALQGWLSGRASVANLAPYPMTPETGCVPHERKLLSSMSLYLRWKVLERS